LRGVRWNSTGGYVVSILGAVSIAIGLMSAAHAQRRPGLGVDVQFESAQGLAISPVPVNLTGRNRFLVGLGSYIVNAQSGCGGCHTHPEFQAGGSPFLNQPEKINTTNYLAGGRTFGPVITSRNLTPEPEEGNKPAGLTLEEFIHVMRTGEDLDKAHLQISPLLQVMPWPTYRKMSDRDLTAIYQYLSSIPAATAGPPGP
jgi:hypothetical protein